MMLWILLIGVPLLLGLIAQAKVSSAFNKWKNVRASSGVTGAEAARKILRAANINDVDVVEINDMLGDHYDPTKKVLCLSSDVYNTPSVAALGIAAHEVGHAIQHAKAYAPLQMRMAVVPATMFVSRALPILILAGFILPAILHLPGMMYQVIVLVAICYGVLAVFQLITLPVEFDASRRAKIILGQMGLVQPGAEAAGVNNVLDSAALTYLAAFVAVLGQLLYWVLILMGNRR
ncbi:MAG: zinc metallopeptidase [Terrimicrobiaceae bacterium]|nr:zinc metallopeptidase [Terrimicrobiaceae bacterium]